MTNRKRERRPTGKAASGTKSRLSNRKKSLGKSTPSKSEIKEARVLMNRNLKLSGLSHADGKKAGFRELTRSEIKALTGEYRFGYLMPFSDIDENPTKFWRIKFTSEPLGAFGSMTKKPRKYYQPIGTTPQFFYPLGFDLKRIAGDVTEPVAMVEGEKKSIKGCKEGIPTFAVCGVWAWRALKKGISAIPDFDQWKWKERKVWLVFDNDLMTNPMVIGALASLSKELHRRGAKVFIKYLPQGKKNKGLDDYLLTHDAKAFIKLREEEYATSAHLWQLNDRIAFIGKVNAYWDFKYRTMYRTTPLLIQQFADLTYPELKADGESFKTVVAADAWTKWEHKRKHDNIGYFPGDDPVVDGIVNTWTPYPVDPVPGNVKPFLDLIDFLFEDAPDPKAWFMQWLAYPLQHPGTKLMQAVLLHSRTQGVGKTFAGEIMGEIYGDNFNIVSQDELHAPFNEWLVSKQFILGEELSGGDNRKDADRLKNMFTRKLFNVNIKFQPTYVMQDCANYLLTSNRVDALFLDDDDRRTFVHEVTAKAKPENFYKRIGKWLDNGGASHLFHYLLNVDTHDFNPRAHALRTVARQNMIDLSKSDLDIWAAQVLANPDDVLRMNTTIVDRELYTATELISFAPSPGGRPATAIGISKALRRVGINHRQIRTHEGNKKLFPLRNSQAWAKCDNAEWATKYKDQAWKNKFQKDEDEE